MGEQSLKRISIPNLRIGKDIHTLSPLEHDALKILWARNGEMRVRDIHMKLRGKRVALTSVAVILDRLHKKRLVSRSISQGRGGSHYLYSPMLTEKDLEISIVDTVVERLIERFGHNAVAYFNRRFSKRKKARYGG